ncbi:MAG: GIY-YIG nuclease family protein [Patescibacteria group bacterium]|nr:GIY-YIG nuclease family protein [Patescibacteria group bacterium]
MFYFYILRCKDGTLYCGSTNNLKQRELLHNTGRGSKYVRSRGGGKIIYSERFRSLPKALKREAEVKTWVRSQKLMLIKSKT